MADMYLWCIIIMIVLALIPTQPTTTPTMICMYVLRTDTLVLHTATCSRVCRLCWPSTCSRGTMDHLGQAKVDSSPSKSLKKRIGSMWEDSLQITEINHLEIDTRRLGWHKSWPIHDPSTPSLPLVCCNPASAFLWRFQAPEESHPINWL